MIQFVQNAYAASPDPTPAFAAVIDPIITNIVSPLIMLMFAVAIIVFVWGVVQMMINGDDAEARQKGRWHMLSGVIGIFIMVSAWGIISLISNTLWGR